MKKTAMLLIMDGFGLAPESPGNAITSAETPNLDRLMKEYPHTRLASFIASEFSFSYLIGEYKFLETQ